MLLHCNKRRHSIVLYADVNNNFVLAVPVAVKSKNYYKDNRLKPLLATVNS